MKQQLKIALLTAVAATIGASSQAYNGDLIFGAYQSGVANTTVFDLGAFSTLQNGQQWNLSSSLNNAGIISLSSATQFGVLGYDRSGSGTLYSTTPGSNPISVANNSTFNDIKSDILTLGSNPGSQPVNSGNDWFTQTISTAVGSTFFNATGLDNPNSSQGSLAYLYSAIGDGSTPTLDGTFSLASDGVLTFSAVPEPSTWCLLTLGGALLLGFRNRSSRKQI